MAEAETLVTRTHAEAVERLIAENSIARADIVDMRPGTVSVMPAGLDQQLSHQELADLIAFLKATKWGAQ